MNGEDPLGYYSKLGVPKTATATEIKAAFRKKAKNLHPDRNPSPDANREFIDVKEAYEVLANPEKRAEYDTSGIKIEEGRSTEENIFEPIRCSFCNKVTLLPRYVIYWKVMSFIYFTQRIPVQGIFCYKCASKKSLESTLITWLLGWWGIPFGFIFSTHAILNNLVGGKRPPDVNVRILLHQATSFLNNGMIDQAGCVLYDVLEVARHLSKKDKHDRELRYEALQFVGAVSEIAPLIAVRKWAFFNRAFFNQVCVLLCAVIVITVATLSMDSESKTTGHTGRRPNQSSERVYPSRRISNGPIDAPSNRINWARPKLCENGRHWPTTSGYIDGYSKKLTDGYSKLTVDNSRGDSDIHVKLCSLNDRSVNPVRVFFVDAFDKFTINKIRKGRYVLIYRDLDSGSCYKTESFIVEEHEREGGIEYSVLELTIYRVIGGNLETLPIPDSDFMD